MKTLHIIDVSTYFFGRNHHPRKSYCPIILDHFVLLSGRFSKNRVNKYNCRNASCSGIFFVFISPNHMLIHNQSDDILFLRTTVFLVLSRVHCRRINCMNVEIQPFFFFFFLFCFKRYIMGDIFIQEED